MMFGRLGDGVAEARMEADAYRTLRAITEVLDLAWSYEAYAEQRPIPVPFVRNEVGEGYGGARDRLATAHSAPAFARQFAAQVLRDSCTLCHDVEHRRALADALWPAVAAELVSK